MEDDEIEVGIRAGGAFDAGTIGPDGDAGEVAMQEREQGFPLFRRDVDGRGHDRGFWIILTAKNAKIAKRLIPLCSLCSLRFILLWIRAPGFFR
jgi:hypothetical protein